MPLPTYPLEVTTNPALTVNRPTNRSPEAYVKTVLQLPVVDPRYQPDKYGTKCNFYVHDVLTLMGYLMPPQLANDMVTRPAVPFVPMVIQDAIQNANLGCPTWAGLQGEPHGHVVVVLPTVPTDQPGLVSVAQAGRINFYGKLMAYSWPKSQLGSVRFYGAL